MSTQQRLVCFFQYNARTMNATPSQKTMDLKAIRQDACSRVPTNKGAYLLCIWIVSIAAFCTYFHRFDEPADIYWDESYHLTSAEKYLNGVFFLETHPPVGKLFLALGEWIFHPNDGIDKEFMTKVGIIEQDMPRGFSYYGYRFFPALLAFLNAPLLFMAFHRLSRSVLLSTAFSSFYVFDNALVLHFRGAMLDSIQVFFVLLAILCFLFAFFRKSFDWKYVVLALLFGFFVGMAAMTKENGLIVSVLGCVIAAKLVNPRKIMLVAAASLVGFVIPVFFGWYLHFNLGSRFVTENHYEMTPSSVEIVQTGEAGRLIHFPRLFVEASQYIWNDNKAAPTLDEFDEEENGSWWYLWPIGGQSINYRWSKVDQDVCCYLYLQSNPVVWFTVLFSVVLTLAMFLMRVFGDHRFSSGDRELLFAAFFSMYVLYMAAMAWIARERVLYLYHYFLPLIFGFFLFSLCTLEVRTFFKWRVGFTSRAVFATALAVLVIAAFVFFSPLTYYCPMSDDDVEARAILRVWNLRPE